MAGLWSVVAEAVVRACLTSIGIVRVLLRRLGLPRALCERAYRPSGRGHRRQRPAHHPGDIAAAAILLDRGWGKAKEMHEHSGRDSRSATAFNFCIQGQIWLTRHLVISSQGVETPLVPDEPP